MTTVGTFIHQADASLALSRLQAVGIEGCLFDEASLALGADTTAIPTRLEVADEDAERAGRILRGEEGPGPLPDDFVPPAEPEVTEKAEGDRSKTTASEIASAFIEGGVITLTTIGLPALAVMACGGWYVPTISGLLLLFCIGGLGGAFVHVCREGQKRAQAEEEPQGPSSRPTDL